MTGGNLYLLNCYYVWKGCSIDLSGLPILLRRYGVGRPFVLWPHSSFEIIEGPILDRLLHPKGGLADMSRDSLEKKSERVEWHLRRSMNPHYESSETIPQTKMSLHVLSERSPDELPAVFCVTLKWSFNGVWKPMIVGLHHTQNQDVWQWNVLCYLRWTPWLSFL